MNCLRIVQIEWDESTQRRLHFACLPTTEIKKQSCTQLIYHPSRYATYGAHGRSVWINRSARGIPTYTRLDTIRRLLQ